MNKQYIVRLISSEDHDVSQQELIDRIRKDGTDRYDSGRKQQAHDFYAPFNVDFFGTIVEDAELDTVIPKMKDEFGAKTQGDRGRFIVPDIAIVYKATNCDMIQHVYEDRLTSDCFKFRSSAIDALQEVRAI